MRPPLAVLLPAAGLVAVAFSTDQPLLLGALLLGGLAWLAATAPPRRPTLMIALILGASVAILNPFVAVEGNLVLIPGPSLTVIDLEVTAEELAYGLALGARLAAVVLVTAAALRLVDGDRLLARAVRVMPRSALTVALAARLVPALRRDAVALSEAARLRGVAPRGRGVGVLLVPLAAASLERGLDQAEALTARGFGSGGRSSLPERRLAVRELLAAAIGCALVALAAALLAGWLPFSYYPRLDAVVTPAAVAAAAAVLAGGGASAFLLAGRAR